MEIPKHVGIIVDGNGRWAENRNLKRSDGHKEGAKRLNELCQHILDKGIKYLSLYVFSTENFKRSEDEVNYLMDLFIKMFRKDFNSLHKKNIRVVFSGRKNNLKQEVLDSMNFMTEKTKNNTKGTINFCLNYGSHFEIIDACKNIAEEYKNDKLDINSLDEELFNKYLYQDLPNLDLLIRTGKEKRVSNFMLWQLAYTEFYFSDVLFPDFTNDEFDKALKDFDERNRRFGGINYEKKTN